ncbi:MAG TPA: helix-turn-helix transcriptional regulator, partial [Chloroflexota bacterium]
MSVGERLRRARLARTPRMTLAELAGERLSISLISKIERGLVQPSLATLAYLAERLDLPLAELVGGEDAGETERALALERVRAALLNDEPAAALSLTDGLDGGDAALLRLRALLALRRDDEALAGLESLPPRQAEAALLRGEALARTGARDLAQDAYGR